MPKATPAPPPAVDVAPNGNDRVWVRPATKAAIEHLAERLGVTHDQLILAGLKSLAARTISPHPLASLDLIRAVDNLEQTTALLAQGTVILSDHLTQRLDESIEAVAALIPNSPSERASNQGKGS